MSANNDKPTGQLFTHVYLERTAPLADSNIFRQRIGSFCGGDLLYRNSSTSNSHAYDLSVYIKHETGFSTPRNTIGFKFEELFATVPIQYALNLITIVWRYLEANARQYEGNVLVSVRARTWRDFVRRALKEENLHYTVDDACGVHYSVDREFEHNRVSGLKCLESSRYAGARVAYEAAFTYLDSNPPDTKAAVRSIFEALEIVARLMVTSKNLHRKLVENEITQLALKLYSNDPTAAKATTQLLAGFGDWVDAIHNYRHGQGSTEPVAPPLDAVVYILSSGTAFLRWLVSIDEKTKS